MAGPVLQQSPRDHLRKLRAQLLGLQTGERGRAGLDPHRELRTHAQQRRRRLRAVSGELFDLQGTAFSQGRLGKGQQVLTFDYQEKTIKKWKMLPGLSEDALANVRMVNEGKVVQNGIAAQHKHSLDRPMTGLLT